METSPPASSPDASPMRLLLVEAGAGGESRIRALLESCGEAQVEISHVRRVDDALPMLRDGGYRAVLLDLGLEGGDGLTALARLRVASAGIPIIALTSREHQTEALNAIRAGAEGSLSKSESDPRLVL